MCTTGLELPRWERVDSVGCFLYRKGPRGPETPIPIRESVYQLYPVDRFEEPAPCPLPPATMCHFLIGTHREQNPGADTRTTMFATLECVTF